MDEIDWSPEAGERLGRLIDTVGGSEAAAEIAGTGASALEDWCSGRARWEFWAVARLSQAAGRSLDWLMRGEAGAPATLDARHVEHAAEFVVRAMRGFPDLQPVEVARAIVQRARDLNDESTLTDG